MSDLISRQAAINKLEPWLRVNGYSDGELNMLKAVLYELENMPSAQPDLDEWCTDCKEYDKEKHHCPRFNRVIREALKDAQPEIIRCKDCKYRGGLSGFYCDIVEKAVGVDSFCSWAERKIDD